MGLSAPASGASAAASVESIGLTLAIPTADASVDPNEDVAITLVVPSGTVIADATADTSVPSLDIGLSLPLDQVTASAAPPTVVAVRNVTLDLPTSLVTVTVSATIELGLAVSVANALASAAPPTLRVDSTIHAVTAYAIANVRRPFVWPPPPTMPARTDAHLLDSTYALVEAEDEAIGVLPDFRYVTNYDDLPSEGWEPVTLRKR